MKDILARLEQIEAKLKQRHEFADNQYNRELIDIDLVDVLAIARKSLEAEAFLINIIKSECSCNEHHECNACKAIAEHAKLREPSGEPPEGGREIIYCKGCENRMSICDCNEPSVHDKPQAPTKLGQGLIKGVKEAIESEQVPDISKTSDKNDTREAHIEKPREWFIELDTCIAYEPGTSHVNEDAVHVIEYSALSFMGAPKETNCYNL